jgi:hypothetical protein
MVGAFTNALQELASVPKEVGDQLRQWSDSIKPAAEALVPLTQSIAPVAKLFDQLAPPLKEATSGLTQSIAPVANAFASLIPPLQAAASAPRKLSEQFVTLANAINIFETALAPSTAIAIIGAIAKASGQGIVKGLQVVGTQLTKAVSAALTPAINATGAAISGAGKILTPVFNEVVVVASNMGKGLATIAEPIINEFKMLGSAIPRRGRPDCPPRSGEEERQPRDNTTSS